MKNKKISCKGYGRLQNMTEKGNKIMDKYVLKPIDYMKIGSSLPFVKENQYAKTAANVPANTLKGAVSLPWNVVTFQPKKIVSSLGNIVGFGQKKQKKIYKFI